MLPSHMLGMDPALICIIIVVHIIPFALPHICGKAYVTRFAKRGFIHAQFQVTCFITIY